MTLNIKTGFLSFLLLSTGLILMTILFSRCSSEIKVSKNQTLTEADSLVYNTIIRAEAKSSENGEHDEAVDLLEQVKQKVDLRHIQDTIASLFYHKFACIEFRKANNVKAIQNIAFLKTVAIPLISYFSFSFLDIVL